MSLLTNQNSLDLDGLDSGPLFAPINKIRPPVRPLNKAGVIHRAQTKRATPHWLSEEQKAEIRKIYARAKRMRVEGLDAVVDHIVPKINPLVCGLHVPWNLRIISSIENTSKGNNYWPDMPLIQLGLEVGLDQE